MCNHGIICDNDPNCARCSIERGLADSAAGRVVDLGDFTQYAGTERLDSPDADAR